MKIQLYLDYISQPSRTVLAFCKLSLIPIQINEIRIAKLQHLSPSYQVINPMKKVPAIVDSEAKLALGESHAIINYLIKKYKLEKKWGLEDEARGAKIDEYLHFHHQNTRKCAAVLYTEVFSRLYSVDQASMEKGNVLRQQVKRVLDFIEQNYFKQSVFLIGACLTVADLSAYFQIQSLVVVEFDLRPWVKISAWMGQISQIPQIKEANDRFMKLLPKIKLPKANL